MRHSILAIGLLELAFLTLVAGPNGQALEVTPPLLAFTAEQGRPNPVTQTPILLRNNTRQRNWVTSHDAPWLSVTVSPAHLVPSDQLLITVDPAGLAAGVYRGTVSIAGIKGERVSIPVTLRITARSFTTPTSSAISKAIDLDHSTTESSINGNPTVPFDNGIKVPVDTQHSSLLPGTTP